MDKNDDETEQYTNCQIGYIENWIPLQQSVANHPSETRIGGIPSYYLPFSSTSSSSSSSSSTETILPSAEFLTCSKCQKSLYLILQIYAETDRERSLHIYGCNNGYCYQNGQTGTWRVWRTQGNLLPVVNNESVVEEEFTVKNVEVTVKNSTQGFSTVQITANDNTSFGGMENNSKEEEDDWGSGGAWGSDEGIQTVTNSMKKISDEQTTFIHQQIHQTSLNIQASSSSLTTDNLSPCIPGKDTIYKFPAFAVETCEEPYEDDSSTDDDENESENDENGTIAAHRKRQMGSFTTTKSSSTATVDKELLHAQQLYEEYLKWSGNTTMEGVGNFTETNDTTNSNLNDGHDDDNDDDGYGDSNDEDDNDDDNDWKEDHPKAQKSKAHAKGGDKRKGNKKNFSGKNNSKSSKEDKDEKISPKLRYMLRFQKKLQKFPEQVVRYAWDGEPLWPVPPSSIVASLSSSSKNDHHHHGKHQRYQPTQSSSSFQPPRCKCGKSRKFELQLLPYILYNLRVDEYTPDILENQANISSSSNHTTKNNNQTISSSLASSTSPSSGTATKPLAFLGGMDFLSVFIYSCEDSCELNHEEYALVIPAED